MRLSPAILRMAQARCRGWRCRLALHAECMSVGSFLASGEFIFIAFPMQRVNPSRARAAGPAQLGIEVGNVPAFKTDVLAGETFLVPPAFVGCYSGDIDDGSYSLHRFVMEKLVPRFPKGYVYPTLAYNLYLDSGGADAEEKGVLQSAALAKELGFETFVVDAMWFPQSGAWYWDPKRFPHGHKTNRGVSA